MSANPDSVLTALLDHIAARPPQRQDDYMRLADELSAEPLVALVEPSPELSPR